MNAVRLENPAVGKGFLANWPGKIIFGAGKLDAVGEEGKALGEGWVADWITRHVNRRLGRCGVAAFGLLLASMFLALASVVLAGGAGAIYLSQSAFWAVTADIAGKSAGTVSGLMNTGGQIGGAVTASLTPWIAEHFGWTASFLTAAAVCLAGALLWALVKPSQPIQARPASPS